MRLFLDFSSQILSLNSTVTDCFGSVRGHQRTLHDLQAYLRLVVIVPRQAAGDA